MSSNLRNTQEIVMARCLTLLARLLRGPAHAVELLKITAQSTEKYEDSFKVLENSALNRRFEEDRGRLKAWFGCEWDYDRKTTIYTLTAVNNPLFDLPNKALRGLAFLQTTFSGENVPMSQEVIALFDALLRIMPTDRREDLQRERGLLELNLNPRDKDLIPDEVMGAVRRACANHQQLEFAYWASSQTDGKPRIHCVEPRRYYFENGHYYLEAYCLETNGPKGKVPQNEMRRYRLGRMAEAHLLPTRFIPGRRSIKHYELVYELSPEIARLGVTEHFPDSVVELHEDGSALIRTISLMLFFDLRTLLHYGPGCRVIGGDEAVKEMKTMVIQMYQRYFAA